MGVEQFRDLKVDPVKEVRVKKTYSVTGDILSYKICPRQYGMYRQRGFQPAHTIQLWFGLAVHQVLNKLNQQYAGQINPGKKGEIPTDADVERFFIEVTNSLAAAGIRAINKGERELALEVISEFNRMEGPLLYPNIIETEYKFQSNFERYLLEGIVDVLKTSEIKGRGADERFADVEIWDYKAAKNPFIADGKKPLDTTKIQKYHYQMLVYAQLYKLKTGKFPRCGRLYFMNELMRGGTDDAKRANAIYTIDFTNEAEFNQISKAMNDFHTTVENIERCRETDCWNPPEKIHDKDTCDGCDLRWNCKSVKYKSRCP